MAIYVGRNAVVGFSTDGGSTYNAIGKVKSASMSSSHDIADATTNDSNGWKEGEYADQQVTVDVTYNYDSSNTAQAAILTEVFTNHSKVDVRFWPDDNTGVEKEWEFQCTVDSFDIDTSTGDIEEASVTFSSDGAVTFATQSH